MYCITDIGGFQYKVAPGYAVRVPTIEAEAEQVLNLDKVLLFNDGQAVSVGKPYLEGATVKAKVMGQGKYDKIIIFKKKRRLTYQKRTGHRQKYTELFILEIACNGKKDVFTPKERKPKEAEGPVQSPAAPQVK